MGFETPKSSKEPEELEAIQAVRDKKSKELIRGGADFEFKEGQVSDITPSKEQEKEIRDEELDEALRIQSYQNKEKEKLPDDKFSWVQGLEVGLTLLHKWYAMSKEKDLSPRELKLLDTVKHQAESLIYEIKRQIDVKYKTESDTSSVYGRAYDLAEKICSNKDKIQTLYEQRP